MGEEWKNDLFECFAVIGIEENEAEGSNDRKAVVKWGFPTEKKEIPGMNGGIDGLAQCAFPKLKLEKKRSQRVPYTYVFGLTLENGQFLYGYCRKILPPFQFNRYDYGKRFPEVLCLVSTRFEIDFYIMKNSTL